MADPIQTWTAATTEESKFMWDYIQQQELDDSFGWGAMTQALVGRMFNPLSSAKERINSCGLLLTGPDGCGKHTAAAHMMTHLAEEDYQMIFLTGRTLAPLGLENAQRVLDTLLADCEKRKRSVCIQLEEMEDVPFRRELLTIFGQQLQNYTFYDDCRLFLILIDNKEQDLPHCLRSRLLLCRMLPPNRRQRLVFLENHSYGLKSAVSLDVFAACTEGATYAQLLDMVAALNWQLDAQDLLAMKNEELEAFLASQMPVPTQEDTLRQLASSARVLAERLPLSGEGPHYDTVLPPDRKPLPDQRTMDLKNFSEAAYLSQRKQEIKNMDSHQLISTVLTQEQKAIIYNRQELITQ